MIFAAATQRPPNIARKSTLNDVCRPDSANVLLTGQGMRAKSSVAKMPVDDDTLFKTQIGAPYQLSDEFLESDPVPLVSFALHDRMQREAFLREFCRRGEPAIFEAVSHIWSSLAHPQEARCTEMGITAGAGGKGKSALVNLLRACLEQMLAWEHPLPRPEEFASVDAWHGAAMAAFAAEAAREIEVLERFAIILDGGGDPGAGANRAAREPMGGPWHEPGFRDR